MYRWLTSQTKTNTKLFTDDMSPYTIVKDINESANVLNNALNNLSLISKWAFDWKMLFNIDPTKPAQEVLFSRKKKLQVHPTISLNNIQVKRVLFQKYLGILLDEMLNFKQHVDNTIKKFYKDISVIKKLMYILPRKSQVTIYKAFLWLLTDDLFWKN